MKIEHLDDWPDCPVEGCANKVCLALDSPYCFVHTPGSNQVKAIDIDVRNIMRLAKQVVSL